jgi:hypothetical protein
MVHKKLKPWERFLRMRFCVYTGSTEKTQTAFALVLTSPPPLPLPTICQVSPT